MPSRAAEGSSVLPRKRALRSPTAPMGYVTTIRSSRKRRALRVVLGLNARVRGPRLGAAEAAPGRLVAADAGLGRRGAIGHAMAIVFAFGGTVAVAGAVGGCGSDAPPSRGNAGTSAATGAGGGG